MTSPDPAHDDEARLVSSVIDAGPGAYDVLELGYDVMDGLTRPFKELSSRFLFDEKGSALFEQILALPEYYQGRAEMEILASRGTELMAEMQPTEMVDIGAGSGEKASILLEAAGGPMVYRPVDLSRDMLSLCEARITGMLPTVAVEPIEADMTRLAEVLPTSDATGTRLIVMFGGTLGNLLLGARRRFLRDIASALGTGGHALIGVDLLKEPSLIEAAYDDSQGVTAEFNRNLLATLNERLGGDFPLDAFDHAIVFDEEKGWIEMRLRARRRCRVTFSSLAWSVEIAPGEQIRTEVSAKFSRASFSAEAEWCGLQVERWLSDSAGRFALPLLAPL